MKYYSTMPYFVNITPIGFFLNNSVTTSAIVTKLGQIVSHRMLKRYTNFGLNPFKETQDFGV